MSTNARLGGKLTSPMGMLFVTIRRNDPPGPQLYVCWDGTLTSAPQSAGCFPREEANRLKTTLMAFDPLLTVRTPSVLECDARS
jgi:hypothetical protein